MVGDFVDFYRAVWWYNELVADAYYDVDTDSDRTVTDGSSSYDDGSSTDDDGSSTDGGSSTEDGSSASDEYGSSTDDGGHFSDDGSHFSDDEDKPTWSRSVRIAAGLALETLGVTLYRVEQTHRAHYALPVQQQGWRLLPRGVRPAHQREAIAAYDALVEARRALTVRRHSEVHTVCSPRPKRRGKPLTLPQSFEARLATSLPRLLPGDAQYAAWAVAVRAFNRQIHLADDGAWLFDRVWKGLPKAWEDPEGEEVNVDHDIC